MRRLPKKTEDSKIAALRTAGALHPSPEDVRDEAFSQNEFFDPRDRMQTKYEMLRRQRVDGRAVSEVAETFGVSRQAFYTTRAAFDAQGLPGLLPQRRGPKGPHKCSSEVLDFAQGWLQQGEANGDASLVDAIRQRFGITVHPRTVERALARREKKLRRSG